MADHKLRADQGGMASSVKPGDMGSIGRKGPATETQMGFSQNGVRATDTKTLGYIAKNDESPVNRLTAVSQLGERKDACAISALSDALKDDNPLIRQAAAYALGQIGDPIAIPALLKTWSLDGNRHVSWEAGSSLESINAALITADTKLRGSSDTLKERVEKSGLAQDDPLVVTANKWLSYAQAGKEGMTNEQKKAVSDSLYLMAARIFEIRESEIAISDPSVGLIISDSTHIARRLIQVQRDSFERKFGQPNAEAVDTVKF